MKALIALVVAAALVGCIPQPDNLTVPATAGRFARLTLALEPNKAFVALRNALEDGVGGFTVVGTLENTTGLRTFWVAIAGQTATVYFRVEPNGDGSLIRALTEPTPPPFPETLARRLDDVAQRIKDKLGLDGYKLEPDR